MKRQTRIQDHLPGLGEVDRHPMWDAPSDDEVMPLHIRMLRKRIASVLTPFDGKPGAQTDVVSKFAATVHMLSCLQSSHDPTWLIARISIEYVNQHAGNYPAMPKHLESYIEAVATNSTIR